MQLNTLQKRNFRPEVNFSLIMDFLPSEWLIIRLTYVIVGTSLSVCLYLLNEMKMREKSWKISKILSRPKHDVPHLKERRTLDNQKEDSKKNFPLLI